MLLDVRRFAREYWDPPEKITINNQLKTINYIKITSSFLWKVKCCKVNSLYCEPVKYGLLVKERNLGMV